MRAFLFTSPVSRPLRFAAQPDEQDYRLFHRIADAQVEAMQSAIDDALGQLVYEWDAVAENTPIDRATLQNYVARLDWPAFGTAMARAFARAAEQAMPAAVEGAAGHLYRDLLPSDALGGNVSRAAFIGRFDLVNPEAVRWIDEHGAELVRQVTTDTRQAIQAIIKRSFEQGIPPDAAGRMIRNVVGLTERGATAVNNYERFLRGFGPGPIESLSKGDIARLARGGIRANQLGKLQRVGLDDERIQKLTESYRQRLINERSETIARTETLRASNEGQLNLWRQARAKGLIAPQVRKKWDATPDFKTCIICRSAGGQTVPLDAPFQTMVGPCMVPQDSHPRCRCGMVLIQQRVA